MRPRASRCLAAPSVWLSAFLFACGGDSGQDPTPTPEPLAVTGVSPADAADGIETGTAVTATFNRDVIAASVTPQTFVLTAGAGPLSTSVAYDAASRTARLAGPLLPGTLYQARLTTGITDDDGEPLSEPEVWSFATADWQPTPVDQADLVGSRAALAVGGDGRLHAAYRDSTNTGLKYATCASDCGSPADWTAIALDGAGDLAYSVSLAIAPDGGLHVLYTDSDHLDLRYATCSDSCSTEANWTTAIVDSVGNRGNFGSLVVDGDGTLHAVYFVFHGFFHLRYATCAQPCTSAEAWSSANIGPVGVGAWRAVLVVDGTGRVHAAWPKVTGDGDLHYATCGSGCDQDANWVLGSVDYFTSNPSLVVDENAGLHLTYYAGETDDLMYATCATQCGTNASWTTTTVDQSGDVGRHTSLTRDADGRLQVVYYDATNADLKYATCASTCTAAASWRSAAVDQDGDVGTWTSAALGPDGRLHVLYHDETAADLKYIH
jgi:hypothetical protein